MKIKVKNSSWQHVSEMPHLERKPPMKQSAFARWLLKALSAGELKDVDFSYTEIGMEKLKKDEPCLILMNHSSFTDLNIAAKLFADRQYHIVCTNDGLVGKAGIMRWIGCVPTCKFIGDMRLIKDMKYCVDVLRSSVVMFPEASYSFDGTATPLPKSVGKLVRLLKVPVIMVRTQGAFLRDPLYNNLQKRSVKVTATVEYLISENDLCTKSVDELNEILQKAFDYDHFREQLELGIIIDEPFRADGLHRALYKCPVCGTEGEMRGEGISLRCNHCGSSWTLLEDGRLAPDAPGEEPGFSLVTDWYAWERACVREEIERGEYRMEEDVDIMVLKDFKAIYRIGEGTLVHTADGLQLTGCDGELDFFLDSRLSYSLYADYFWYELGDMISIGETGQQFYCFPKRGEKAIVAKARLAAEELYKIRAEKRK